MLSLIRGRLAPSVILACMIAGCAAERDLPPPPPPAPDPVAASPSEDVNSVYTATYVCDDGTRLDVRFINGPTLEDSRAVVSTGEGAPLVLPQKIAASGIWYATPRHELRGKGRDATWTAGRRAAAHCQATD
ncbi:MliC family protein [Tistrella mobilis]|uniref:Membrane-bound lysozyme inhibitor of C-type lysozyme n=1 Tax=Tistrella mobilis (strain KA081020-065) TaxID=1110502 RepID=I3TT43_TISMK|nr:MliC family protein [Tistrella mobilis]AFK55931.1 Membrane-bound lysozyme inhibitor of C-type lysozyme [Tistrella mobilis KA081020-065]